MSNENKKENIEINITQHQLDLLLFCVNEEYHRMTNHFYSQPNKYIKMSYEINDLKKYLYKIKNNEK